MSALQEYENYSIKKSTLTSIADSVRSKTGKTDLILTENISAEIDSIIRPYGSITINENGVADVTNYATATVSVAEPVEVSSEAEMTAILESATAEGGIYKYVGTTTDTYENGALYIIEKEDA